MNVELNITRRIVRWVLVVGLLSTALAIGPASPSAAAGEDETAAAEQLANDHGVSLTEASARIGRQDRTLALAQEAARTIGDRFGGVWTDHARGGTIFVGATGTLPTAEVGRLAAAHGLTGFVRGKTVQYSYGHLLAAAQRLGSQVGAANLGGPDTLEVGVRPDVNRVEIALPKTAALTAAQQRFLDSARSTYGAALLETRTALRSRADGCAFPYCDPSLRGGVRINSANGVGCTAGFMAKKTDGSRWVMTAGHCLYGAGFNPWQLWGTRNANGTTRTIGGAAQGWWFGGGHADHAVFSVDKVAVETPKNWVYYKSAVPAYTITSASDISALWGTYLCKTGIGSGAHCGSVLSPHLTVTYGSGVTVTGMVKANIFRCAGDSGGPVYASHKAYGLHSGGVNEIGSCGSKAYFTPIHTATAELGVSLLLT